jgi:hypothetical protein
MFSVAVRAEDGICNNKENHTAERMEDGIGNPKDP